MQASPSDDLVLRVLGLDPGIGAWVAQGTDRGHRWLLHREGGPGRLGPFVTELGRRTWVEPAWRGAALVDVLRDTPGGLPLSAAAAVLSQVADALEHVDPSRGVDIEEVLIDTSGRVRRVAPLPAAGPGRGLPLLARQLLRGVDAWSPSDDDPKLVKDLERLGELRAMRGALSLVSHDRDALAAFVEAAIPDDALVDDPEAPASVRLAPSTPPPEAALDEADEPPRKVVMARAATVGVLLGLLVGWYVSPRSAVVEVVAPEADALRVRCGTLTFTGSPARVLLPPEASHCDVEARVGVRWHAGSLDTVGGGRYECRVAGEEVRCAQR